jgi:hypothetical protein
MKKVAGFLVVTFVFGVAVVAKADHALPRKPHWKGNTVKFYDSVEPVWDAALVYGSSEWNLGLTDVTTTILPDVDTLARRAECKYIKRAVHVCNYPMGTTGDWTNIAGRAYFTYSLPDRHFIKAKIILNDSNPSIGGIRNEVTVHEMGHTLGLDHRVDVNPSVSCMEAVASPGNDSPDGHDYQVVNKLHRNHSHTRTAADAADADYVDRRDDPQYHEVRSGNRVHVTWTLKVPA